jgi:uncharacterized protein YeeX (DUF496 family)
MKKPNLFLVGAAKAGTTSVYHYLKSHPDIYGCPIKEPNYFGSDIQWNDFRDDYKKDTYLNFEKYLSKNELEFHHNAFVDSLENYEALFRDSENEKYVLDASTSYLYSKRSAKEIKQYNQDARIIIILRNPVERTISHYIMDCANRIQLERDITKDIKLDYFTAKKGYGISNLYIELSLYYEQVLRYKMVFPKNQLLILNYGALKEDPVSFIHQVLSFLGLDCSENRIDFETKHNQAFLPSNKFINLLYKKKNLIPAFLIRILKQKKDLYSSSNPKIPEDVREFVREIVAEDWAECQKFFH